MWEIWVWSLAWEDPLEEGHSKPPQHSCLENPHGERSLVGYSPWGCKELDTGEQLRTAQSRPRTKTRTIKGLRKRQIMWSGALNQGHTRSQDNHLTCWLQNESKLFPFWSLLRTHPDKTGMLCYAKSLHSCLTLWDPIDSSPPGSPNPGILQARILEWVANSFSNAWKWKVKVKSLCHAQLFAISWTAAYQAPPSMGFSRQEYWSGVPLPSPDKTGIDTLSDHRAQPCGRTVLLGYMKFKQGKFLPLTNQSVPRLTIS